MPSGILSWSFSIALVLCVESVPGRVMRRAQTFEPLMIAQQLEGPIAVPGSADVQQPRGSDEGESDVNPGVPMNNQNNQFPGDPAAAQESPGEMGDNPATEPSPRLGGELDNPAAEPTPNTSDDNPPSPPPAEDDND